MADFNPYDVLLRPVGRFTSEKVLNAAERLAPGELAEFRTSSRKAVSDIRTSIQDDETLTKEEKAKRVQKETRKLLHHRRADRRTQNANQNKIVFDVRPTATKPQIKRAIEQVYDVKVVKVNTLHTKRGKRAIIKLSEADNAEDIYTRLGQM